ncbi:MAG: Z1 domain-containing protein [Mycoplasmataceae bacterium]|nr:Z1 domain-containing protein [Mycoplasmataceae bacterium]
MSNNFDSTIYEYIPTNSILVIGQVQSGKTNYILREIENIYETYENTCEGFTIIVFGGTTTDLLKQTKERFEKKGMNIFSDYEMYFQNYSIYKKNKVLLVIMKEGSNFEKINNKLKYFNWNRRLFIFDDEADYFSISGNDGLIHETLTNLKDITKKSDGCFYSITATPFKNIEFIRKNPEYYDKIIFLEPNKYYCGYEFFYNLKSDIYLCLEDNKQSKKINKSILVSFFIFLYDTYLIEKEFPNEKSEFLINIDSLTEKHDEIREELIKIIFLSQNSWPKVLEQVIKENAWKQKFKNKEIFVETWKGMKRIVNTLDIQQNIVISNGRTKENYISGSKKYICIIGGTKLSRGFTYKYLTTELIMNSGEKPQIDSLLQRARWFGYRRENKEYVESFDRYKYITVLCSENIYKVFTEEESKEFIVGFYNLQGKTQNEIIKYVEGKPELLNKLCLWKEK